MQNRDEWLLRFTDISVPSQHTLEGRRYAGEVVMSHVLGKSSPSPVSFSFSSHIDGVRTPGVNKTNKEVCWYISLLSCSETIETHSMFSK